MTEMHEETSIQGVGVGLLIPQQQHRWRLEILGSVPLIDEVKELLKRQIVSFQFNYHLQIIEMVLEQNMNNAHLHTLVKQLSKLSKINDYDKISFVVECMDGNEEVTGRFMFSACKLLDHNFVLDYADSSACMHALKFSFKETKDLT